MRKMTLKLASARGNDSPGCGSRRDMAVPSAETAFRQIRIGGPAGACSPCPTGSTDVNRSVDSTDFIRQSRWWAPKSFTSRGLHQSNSPMLILRASDTRT